MGEALYDSAVMRSFVGIDSGNEPVPDETTVCKFRHLLEEHGLGGQMLETVNLHLQSKEVRITTKTIVDATLIHADVLISSESVRGGDPLRPGKTVTINGKWLECAGICVF